MPVSTVFVGLLDEGIEVWRPAHATDMGHGRYRLIRPENYDPSDETWEFPPGAVVECEVRTLSTGPGLVAVRLAT